MFSRLVPSACHVHRSINNLKCYSSIRSNSHSFHTNSFKQLSSIQCKFQFNSNRSFSATAQAAQSSQSSSSTSSSSQHDPFASQSSDPSKWPKSSSSLAHPFKAWESSKPASITGQPHGKHYAANPKYKYVTARELIHNDRIALYDDPNDPTRKMSTNISGIEVIPNARAVLESLLMETINKCKSYKRNFFNVHTVKDCEYMLRVMATCKTDLECEDELNHGQLEELIEDLEEQYDMIIQYNEDWLPNSKMTSEDAQLASQYGKDFGEDEPGSIEFFPRDQSLSLADPHWDEIWADIDLELGYKPRPKMTPEEIKEWEKQDPIDKYFFEPRYPTEEPKPISAEALEMEKIENPFPIDYNYDNDGWDIQAPNPWMNNQLQDQLPKETKPNQDKPKV